VKILRASRRVTPLVGGQEIHVVELTRVLANMGISQELLFSEGSPDLPEGVLSTRLAVPRWGGNILTDAVFGKRVARFARGSHIDVVHTHGDAPVSWGGHHAALASRALHVHTFHAGLMTATSRRMLLRRFLPIKSWYLAVSEAIASDLKACGVASGQIVVRPSGVRSAFFQSPMKGRRKWAVIGGRLGPLRRVLEFVRLWEREQVQEAILCVFGDGPDAKAIARIAAQTPSVKWLGPLDAAGLIDLLGQSTVGIVLSQPGLSEGTPTLVLEMLASGCVPIVAKEAGSAPKIIRELQLGEVVPEIPHPSVVVDLAKRYASPEYEEKRRLARRWVHSNHSWEAVGQSVHNLYKDLLTKHTRSG
jgi:glycosyltransferase involved in cell wall biosynthesis